jgi:hypothetical protein
LDDLPPEELPVCKEIFNRVLKRGLSIVRLAALQLSNHSSRQLWARSIAKEERSKSFRLKAAPNMPSPACSLSVYSSLLRHAHGH